MGCVATSCTSVTFRVNLEHAVARSGYDYGVLQRKPSWRVNLAPIRADGKQYLDCLSANTRQQIRRAMRLYEKRGPLTANACRYRAGGSGVS